MLPLHKNTHRAFPTRIIIADLGACMWCAGLRAPVFWGNSRRSAGNTMSRAVGQSTMTWQHCMPEVLQTTSKSMTCTSTHLFFIHRIDSRVTAQFRGAIPWRVTSNEAVPVFLNRDRVLSFSLTLDTKYPLLHNLFAGELIDEQRQKRWNKTREQNG